VVGVAGAGGALQPGGGRGARRRAPSGRHPRHSVHGGGATSAGGGGHAAPAAASRRGHPQPDGEARAEAAPEPLGAARAQSAAHLAPPCARTGAHARRARIQPARRHCAATRGQSFFTFMHK